MKDELEAMIDREGLQSVIEAISEICAEKADHLEANWQDKQQASVWSAACMYLQRVMNTKPIQAATF